MGPRDGPPLLPQNVVEGREGLTCVQSQTQGAHWLRCVGEWVDFARDPSFPAVPFPVVPGHPCHTPQSQDLPPAKPQRPGQNTSAAPYRPDRGWRPREGQGQDPVQSTSQVRWELGWDLYFLICILNNFQHSLKQFLQGPRGDWRKMQSNQLSHVVITKITTTPISV